MFFGERDGKRERKREIDRETEKEGEREGKIAHDTYTHTDSMYVYNILSIFIYMHMCIHACKYVARPNAKEPG